MSETGLTRRSLVKRITQALGVVGLGAASGALPSKGSVSAAVYCGDWVLMIICDEYEDSCGIPTCFCESWYEKACYDTLTGRGWVERTGFYAWQYQPPC